MKLAVDMRCEKAYWTRCPMPVCTYPMFSVHIEWAMSVAATQYQAQHSNSILFTCLMMLN